MTKITMTTPNMFYCVTNTEFRALINSFKDLDPNRSQKTKRMTKIERITKI